MKDNALFFKFIANACGIFIGKNGSKILCDPWIKDGVFEGSWCHYPELVTTFSDISDVDAIYISHLHPDHFDERTFLFDKNLPIIVLDHGPNFLIRKLNELGYNNLIKVKDKQTIPFKEFNLTLFAPFAKHNFHEATVGNLIDSAILIECDGVKAFNANDNTPTVETCFELKERFGLIDLAMINYNAAGPYPSCFDNLTEEQKIFEGNRVSKRNFDYMAELLNTLTPKYTLPFAGAYVLGGKFSYKNKYLGTTTWDECARYLRKKEELKSKIVLLQENDTLNISTGQSDKIYIPVDVEKMHNYIEGTLKNIKYPYESDPIPDEKILVEDLQLASERMSTRMGKFNITSTFNVIIEVFNKQYKVYPKFSNDVSDVSSPKIICKLDERLMRRILNKESHWNNAEIGAHISFIREPNTYEPDLHMGLQFLHL